MTDRPILFSSSMVRALLEGRKTQTRRVLVHETAVCREPAWEARKDADGVWRIEADAPDLSGSVTPLLRFAKGDRLYVREAWKTTALHDATAPRDLPNSAPIHFTADDRLWPVARYRQGMHMPRWASRLTLTVTDVRVQRVQEVWGPDVRAEGIDIPPGPPLSPVECDYWAKRFAELWNSINAKRGFGWEANPWVVALTFTVERRNIDAKP